MKYFFCLLALCTIAFQGVSAQNEFITKTVTGSVGTKPVDVVETYRNGQKIMSVKSIDGTSKIFTVYYKNQAVASFYLTPKVSIKETILGNQLPREVAIQWLDKNNDGTDEYLLISTPPDPGFIEAFAISETGLSPLPQAKFSSVVEP